jgi:hypothetical protein
MIAHAKANGAKGAAVRAANRTAGKAVKPTYRRPPRDGGWVGCNDILPCCSSVAAANSLYAVTGWRVADDDVYALHFAAGGTAETGVGLLRVMETLTDRGLAGVRISGAVLVDAFPHGAVAGVLVPGWEWHAVAVAGAQAASWGTLLDGEVLDYAWEVWALDW